VLNLLVLLVYLHSEHWPDWCMLYDISWNVCHSVTSACMNTRRGSVSYYAKLASALEMPHHVTNLLPT